MTGRLGFGRTLHYRRPVADVMEVDHLELDANTELEPAALLGMSSAFLGLGADALVRFADGWGTVASSRLLQHVKDIHRQRANEVVQERARLQALVENAVDVMFIVAAEWDVCGPLRSAHDCRRPRGVNVEKGHDGTVDAGPTSTGHSTAVARHATPSSDRRTEITSALPSVHLVFSPIGYRRAR